MSILDEFRFRPVGTPSIDGCSGIAVFWGGGHFGDRGIPGYRIVKPQRSSSEINMTVFRAARRGKFSVPGAGQRKMVSGLMGAPAIVPVPRLWVQRGELFTWFRAAGSSVHVFVFDFVAHGRMMGLHHWFSRSGRSARAIDELARRNDVDKERFGLWGYNLGAYAALREAESDKRVRALILTHSTMRGADGEDRRGEKPFGGNS